LLEIRPFGQRRMGKKSRARGRSGTWLNFVGKKNKGKKEKSGEGIAKREKDWARHVEKGGT